jgi:MOSC domain-containing protein YiiM
MQLYSLNVAHAAHVNYNGREVLTGQHKAPIASAELGAESLDGDSVGDPHNHGGPDKAVNVYAHDHYAYWEGVFGAPLQPGAFSENLTVKGALELDVCIGDRWRIGTAVLEVSQPRMPCFKLALKHDKRHLVEWVQEAGYTGFYMRTITAGLLHSGATITVIAHDPHRISIADINAIYYGRGEIDMAAIARTLAVPALSQAARAVIAARLARAGFGPPAEKP